MIGQKNRPIVVVVGFNLLTLFVFITAPVRWDTDNLVELSLFVLLCQLLVLLGFRLGRRTGLARTPDRELPLFYGDRFVSCLFAIYILTFLVSYAYRMELAPFDVTGMVRRLLAGLQDPHSGYASTLEKSSSGGPVRWRAYFAISVFNQLFFPAGFLYWRRLGLARRVVFIGFVGIDLFYWVATATAVGVVTLATTFGLSSLFWPTRVGRRSVRKVVGNALLLFFLLAGSIAFFSYNLYRRSNFVEIDVDRFEIAQLPVVSDYPALVIVPRPLQPTYLKVVLYMGQGYYHTCLAFDLDFRWTKFVGNNPALIALADRLGVAVWDDTYMHRLQREGIDEYGVWHSAYTWFASDVSFYGVPVLLFCFGCMFGFSWGLGAQGDFLSRLVFIMLGNMLLFLFANNTYLSSVFYAFMVFVPFWILTRLLPVALLGLMKRRRTSARRRLEPPSPRPRTTLRGRVGVSATGAAPGPSSSRAPAACPALSRYGAR